MKVIAFLLLLIFAEAQERYAVTLISLMPQSREDQKLLQEDRRAAYNILMKYLKPHCRFFDEDLYRRRIDDMYRKNPDLDPTDLQNKLAALSLPTKLIVVIKAEVSAIQDAPFQRVYRHQAETTIKVVDKSGWSEIYAQAKGKTPKLILVPPLHGKTAQHWQKNRHSRYRAIEESITPLIPDILDQLNANREILNSFDFLAVRLFDDKKNAMWQVLDEISSDKIQIQDKKYTTDQGIAAKIIYKNGAASFIKELEGKFANHNVLSNMVCETDGINVKVYPKEQEISPITDKQKFTGKIVLTPDIDYIRKQKLEEQTHYQIEQTFMKEVLWQNMQANYRMFDESDLWKKLKDERLRMQTFAATHPTDYVAKKNHVATHTVYYWATTSFKTKEQKYCFAKLGVRVVRMVTGETVAYYQLDSASEFQRGVMVTRDEEHAIREAISLLTKRAITKVTTLLAKEKNFEIYQPRIEVIADDFNRENLEKLKGIFQEIQAEKMIRLANGFESGDGFLRCEIVPIKEVPQPRLRQMLIEYSEAEELLIKIQTQIGKIYISPAN